MDMTLWGQWELICRLAVAAVCGLIIGYERNNRLKEAGMRTHMIVAVGSALIMIVSKYGFGDVLFLHSYSIDPSRIAAQIVSGVGFLGAGIIFEHRKAVSGLTTAAGIWATAGIGMAIGADLYFVGIVATFLVLFIQILLHKRLQWLHLPTSEQIDIEFSEKADAISFVQTKFGESNIKILNLKVKRTHHKSLLVTLFVKLPPNFSTSKLMDLFKDNPHILSIEY